MSAWHLTPDPVLAEAHLLGEVNFHTNETSGTNVFPCAYPVAISPRKTVIFNFGQSCPAMDTLQTESLQASNQGLNIR